MRFATFCLLSLTLLGGAVGCTGVARRTSHSVVRCWADHNTQNAPAFHIEKLNHLPPKAPRVDAFRWMYGLPPGKAHDSGDCLDSQSWVQPVVYETGAAPVDAPVPDAGSLEPESSAVEPDSAAGQSGTVWRQPEWLPLVPPPSADREETVSGS